MSRHFAALLLFAAGVCVADDDASELQERGRYLLHAGGCITCHTEDADDAVPLAGGRAMVTEFGTFYSPNITPDEETGIGNWTDQDFRNAFWDGVNPDGDHYFPAFPYTSYTGMSEEDVLALAAYLLSIEPVRKENAEHDLPLFMSTRLAAGAWKARYFDAGRFIADKEKSESWNRGAYLVRHLGHCGECHTPRGALGVLDNDREMAGYKGAEEGEGAPNITPHRSDGIGRWKPRDIDYFLEIGMEPDGDFAGGSMADVIEDNTGHLTREDRLAMAEYLLSLPPLESEDD